MKRAAVSGRWYGQGRSSELTWDVRVSRSRESGGRWQCGDRKKLRRLVSRFSKECSMHGTHYICSRDSGTSGLRKTVYRLFIGGCLLLMSLSVLFLAQDSFSAESMYISSTSKDGDLGREEDAYFPLYPQITVCRSPGYRTDLNASQQELIEYAYLALGFPFSPLTPDERSLIVENIFRKINPTAPLHPGAQNMSEYLEKSRRQYDRFKNSSWDFNVTQFIMDNSVSCEDIFIRCIAFVLHQNCCRIFQPTLTTLGLCHSLKADKSLLALESMGRNIGFTFLFDLQDVPRPRKALDVGYTVYVSDPREEEQIFSDNGKFIMNGYVTNMRTKLVKTQRTAMYTPWHGLSTDCPTIPELLGPHHYGDRYFRLSCGQMYINMVLRRECNCKLLTVRGAPSPRVCDPVDMYNCFIHAALKDNLGESAHFCRPIEYKASQDASLRAHIEDDNVHLTNMQRQCQDPCIEYSYETEASYVGLGGTNTSRLIFQYDGAQYVFNEYRKTTVSSFMSQIGGSLGLYVGASIVTAVELATFVVCWLWYRCLPNKAVAGSADLHRKASERNHYFD